MACFWPHMTHAVHNVRFRAEWDAVLTSDSMPESSKWIVHDVEADFTSL